MRLVTVHALAFLDLQEYLGVMNSAPCDHEALTIESEDILRDEEISIKEEGDIDEGLQFLNEIPVRWHLRHLIDRAEMSSNPSDSSRSH